MNQNNKPIIRIFIGSSGNDEARTTASAVQSALRKVNYQIEDYTIVPRLWYGGKVFKNGEITLISLLNELNNDDAAIFIYNGDDEIIRDGELMKVTRANVIFEHGLFVGRLGKEKTFIILNGNEDKLKPDLNKILSDYSGVSCTVYKNVNNKRFGLVKLLRDWIVGSVIRNNKYEDYRITASIVESQSTNDNRNNEFKTLYQKADKGDSIKVLGLGVTNFLNGEDIDDLLQKGVNITVLLMAENIIKKDDSCEFEKLIPNLSNVKLSLNKNSCPVNITNILIDKNHFTDYQNRLNNSAYLKKMHNSYENCERYSKDFPSIFNFHFFNSFIPMSITAFLKKGEQKAGRLIVEFIIPFTKNRIMLKVLEEENKAIFDTFLNFYNLIEERSIKSENSEMNND